MKLDLKETRHQLVSKDNRLIQNGYFCFSEIEWKAVQFIVSKVQPGDSIDKTYAISCAEFKAILNWDMTCSYTKIKIMLQNIADKSWWYSNEERHKDELVRWFDIVDIDNINDNDATSYVYIRFHSRMETFLMHLQERLEQENKYYTSYELQNITLMKHVYSIRLYDILKSYQYNNKRWTFENGTGSEYDIQKKLAKAEVDPATRKTIYNVPVRWKNWNTFRKDVLDPAVKDINKYSDIKIAYVGKKEDMSHRKTRANSTIEFYMVAKTDLEKIQTEEIIDKEYNQIEDEANFHQVTMDEFFESCNNAIEESKEYFANEESKYPMIREVIGYDTLTEEQVDFLYKLLIEDCCKLSKESRSLYVCDFIDYYVRLCKATPGETKTELFYRVKSLILDDRDNMAIRLMKRYGDSNAV